MSKKLITALAVMLVTSALAAFSMTGVLADTGAAANDSILPSIEETAGDIGVALDSSMEGDVCVAVDTAAAQDDAGVPTPSAICIPDVECSEDWMCGANGFCRTRGTCMCL